MSIDARIAEVISATDVAFNAGLESGVTIGSIATIFRETQVNDPDSGEPLGIVRRPAVRFKINEVHQRFSVGTTTDHVRRADSSLFPGLKNQPERIRVTTDSSARDYRTRVIEIGQYVEIDPPENEATSTE